MSKYEAADIEVSQGLEPVRRRPGMYTDTTRPNHLAAEVVDNSVDEALAGHARKIDVTLHADGSVSVADDGRGMPVDPHPEHKLPGVELIMTRLHAGGKFSGKNYTFSGGLHGVGVSVVNALSKRLECRIKRAGAEYSMAFENGDTVQALEQVAEVGKRNTGTWIRFWPDPGYFDSPNISRPRLKHLLKAKAILCPGLTITLVDEERGERDEWLFEEGLTDYLSGELEDVDRMPAAPFTGEFSGEFNGDRTEAAWALCWVPEGELIQESYVNLIPTPLGGTHVNGLRTGLIEALREFCDIRNLLPRGVRLAPEDAWERLSFVLSVKLREPQFSGQTKERLSSREASSFVSGLVKDAFSLWLNKNTADGAAQGHRRSCAAGQAGRLRVHRPGGNRTVPGGRRFGRRQRQAGAQPRVPGHHAAQRQDPEHLGDRPGAGAGLAGNPRPGDCRRCRSGIGRPVQAALRQGHRAGRRRFRRAAHRHPALGTVPASFPAAGRRRPDLHRHAAAVPHRRRQADLLRAGRR